jgi:Haem-binding domain
LAALKVYQGVSTSVTNHSFRGPARVWRGTGFAFGLLLAWSLASVFVHPLSRGASDRAATPLLAGAEISPSVANVFAQACINCHSENTHWPWYSHVVPVSWLVENDVKRARERLNLSRWDNLDAAGQRLRLTAIATVVENQEMPPHRYVALHPEARLSADDSAQVVEWTQTERHRLSASASSLTAK